MDARRSAWLLGVDGPPSGPVPSPDEVEGLCAFALASWQVLPVTAPRLLDWVGPSISPARAEQLVSMQESVSALARVQSALAHRFARALESEHVPYTFLKGSAARLSAYRHPDDRGGLDVDVAVPAAAIRRAEAIAGELGFEPAMLVDEERRRFRRVGGAIRAAVEAEHYELACLVRRQVITGLEPEVETAVRASLGALRPWHEIDGQLACYVTLDVHHGLSLDIPVEAVVETAVRAGTQSVYVAAPYWQVFHLIFKIYWEGVHNYRKGAYQYADLVRLLPLVTPEGADALLQLLRAYRLEAAAYYVLRRLETDLGLTLNGSIGELVAEQTHCPATAFPLEVNDLGDMWPKLWGVR
jgi:hypothetical protein